MNESSVCSVGVERLLCSTSPSDGADKSLERIRLTKRAQLFEVEGDTKTFIAITYIHEGQVVSPVPGKVLFEDEISRPPGGLECTVRYEHLIKRALTPTICFETNFIRRSCEPNCVLKHIVRSESGRNAVYFVLVALQNILPHQEITIQFDPDWIQLAIPLRCTLHRGQIKECPFERKRVETAEKRRMIEGFISLDTTCDSQKVEEMSQTSAELNDTTPEVFLNPEDTRDNNHQRQHDDDQKTDDKYYELMTSSSKTLLRAVFNSQKSTEKVVAEKYRVDEPSLKLENAREHSRSRQNMRNPSLQKTTQNEEVQDFSEFGEFEKQMFEFLFEKSKNVLYPEVMCDLWKEFNEKTGSNDSASKLHSRFRTKISKRIHELEIIDTESKLRLIFMTSTPVDNDFLNELRKDANVNVDANNRITFYQALRNNLKLKGEHSGAAKKKYSTQRKRSIVAEKRDNKPKRRISSEELEDEVFDTPEPVVEPPVRFDQRNPRNLLFSVKEEIEDDDIIVDYQSAFTRKEAPTPADTFKNITTRNLNDFLRLLKCLVAPLNDENTEYFLQEIQKLDEKLGNSDKIIPIAKIQRIIRIVMTMATESRQISQISQGPSSRSHYSTTSLREFLKLLKIMILGFDSPELRLLLEDVDTKIQNLGDYDKQIPSNETRVIIEKFLSAIYF